MRRRRTTGRGAALLSAGLVIGLLPTTAAATATAATAPAAAVGSPTGTATVTLVTGDKVTVTDVGQGKKTVTVRRPPGATGAVRTTSPSTSAPTSRGTSGAATGSAPGRWVPAASRCRTTTTPPGGTSPSVTPGAVCSRRRVRLAARLG